MLSFYFFKNTVLQKKDIPLVAHHLVQNRIYVKIVFVYKHK